jgi:hypothetical protein
MQMISGKASINNILNALSYFMFCHKGTKAAILDTCKHSTYNKETFDKDWRALGMAPGDGLNVTYLKQCNLRRAIILVHVNKLIV